MMGNDRQQVLTSTQEWVEKFVIGLNICPFAGKVVQEKSIRYRVVSTGEIEEMYRQFLSELSQLIDSDPKDLETSLVIYPEGPADFATFWDFAGLCEEGLESAGLSGVVQVVAFHPQYRFEGEAPDAPSTFTNRSPHPMLHLLRESSVEQAVKAHPDIDSIPSRNIALLEEMGLEGIRKAIED